MYHYEKKYQYLPKTRYKYKDRKPTLNEFDLNYNTVELISKEKKAYYNRIDKIEKILSIVALIITILINLSLLLFLKWDLTLKILLFIFIMPTFIYWLIYGIFSLFKLMFIKKFSMIDEENRYKDYDNALKDYYWWQKRKQKDFWMNLSGRQFEIEISSY